MKIIAAALIFETTPVPKISIPPHSLSDPDLVLYFFTPSSPSISSPLNLPIPILILTSLYPNPLYYKRFPRNTYPYHNRTQASGNAQTSRAPTVSTYPNQTRTKPIKPNQAKRHHHVPHSPHAEPGQIKSFLLTPTFLSDKRG